MARGIGSKGNVQHVSASAESGRLRHRPTSSSRSSRPHTPGLRCPLVQSHLRPHPHHLRFPAASPASAPSLTATNSPLVSGAFPSLHAGWALGLVSGRHVSTYVGVLRWGTVYLTHHYLIVVGGGGCRDTAFSTLHAPYRIDRQILITPLRRAAHSGARCAGDESREGGLDGCCNAQACGEHCESDSRR